MCQVSAQAGDDLNPIRVLALFSAVSDEDCDLLALAGRPKGPVIHLRFFGFRVQGILGRGLFKEQAGWARRWATT